MFHSKLGGRALPSLACAAIAIFLVAGCGSSMTTTINNSKTPTGSSFVVGTDAPMASVVSFNVQVTSITATDANNNTVQLISGSPMVDFARFNGLQTLLDMNDVPVGTYSNVTITLGNGTIGYLDTSTAEPTIQSMSANISPSSVTYTLKNPMVVAESARLWACIWTSICANRLGSPMDRSMET